MMHRARRSFHGVPVRASGCYRSAAPWALRFALTLTLTAPYYASVRAAGGKAGSCAIEPAFTADLIKFRGLNGADPILADSVRGRVVLLVNTASYCGYTKQLRGLEALHQRYGARGLSVIGIPCNDFGGQEPDAEDKIAGFYANDFGVTFPVAGKYSVAGGEAHALYLHLAHKLGDAGVPPWNFHKYMLGRGGDIVGLFDPSVDPLDASITEAIERELAEPIPAAVAALMRGERTEL